MEIVRSRRSLRALALVPLAAGMLAFGGPAGAAATTVSATAGPVAIPGVPVNVCVDDGTLTCTPTPASTSVSLTASATVDPAAVTPPTVVPGACSNGQGVALVVTTGSAGTLITGAVTVTVNGTPTIVPIGLPASPPNQTVIISACVAPGVGVPGVPALPGMPAVPGVPTLPGVPLPGVGDLLTGLLSSVLGLLGGAPTLPGLPI